MQSPVAQQLLDLYDAYAVLQFDDELHDEARLDLAAGTAEMKTGLVRRLPLQVLGVESLPKLEWTWAWGNHRLRLPEQSLELARELRTWGESTGLAELTTERLSTERSDVDLPDLLSVIAWSRRTAPRFCCVQRRGTSNVYCLALGEPRTGPDWTDRSDPLWRLAETFQHALSRLPLKDQRRAYLSLLRGRGLSPEEHGPMVSGTAADGRATQAWFDENNRLQRQRDPTGAEFLPPRGLPSEHSVEGEHRISESITGAVSLLKLEDTSVPSRVIQAISDFAARKRTATATGKTSLAAQDDLHSVARLLGSLWANQLRKTGTCDLVELDYRDTLWMMPRSLLGESRGNPGQMRWLNECSVALVAKDRSAAVFPYWEVLALLVNPERPMGLLKLYERCRGAFAGNGIPGAYSVIH
jgi:hypothetical protein